MNLNLSNARILISRVDAIGDVMLTLPLCGMIKKYYPDVTIIFLGRKYTEPVLKRCSSIDQILIYDEWTDDNTAVQRLRQLQIDIIIHVLPNRRIAMLARKAAIPIRIGTSRRWFHWLYANKHVYVKRKNTKLHEAQLNMKLLKAIAIREIPALEDLHQYTSFSTTRTIPHAISSLIEKDKQILIIHPKSAGSAREWPLSSYDELIRLFPKDRYQIVICGTKQEKSTLGGWLTTLPDYVYDMMGKLSLDEYIEFISSANIFVAASTGPLHIAAACGIRAIGIYPPVVPMHPARWQPLGSCSGFITASKTNCHLCSKKSDYCRCMSEISAYQVYQKIMDN
jgi:ADP-heptose:LPS heptosyltransferase